jgi:hypothetical protein
VIEVGFDSTFERTRQVEVRRSELVVAMLAGLDGLSEYSFPNYAIAHAQAHANSDKTTSDMRHDGEQARRR